MIVVCCEHSSTLFYRTGTCTGIICTGTAVLLPYFYRSTVDTGQCSTDLPLFYLLPSLAFAKDAQKNQPIAKMPPQEIDPLLVKDRSTLMVSSSTSSVGARNKNKCLRVFRDPKGTTLAATLLVFLLSGVLVSLIFKSEGGASSESTPSVPQPIESGLVEVSSDGDYIVHYQERLTRNTTFAELAQLMLPPWCEASLMAINDGLQPDTMDPTNVQKARKVLLTTRDLLDVFSPVYPTKSIWSKVRALYKDGYEKVGYYQDLDHAHIDYSPDLWEQRHDDVMLWKATFASYASKHDVLGFLSGDVTDGCYDHKESHLFWGEMDGKLPCGYAPATPSLQSLASVQLHNALNYLQTIVQYDTVLGEVEEETFHNFRKELRSFLDEYDLFGFVLLPNAGDYAKPALDLLKEARQSLGDINDKWTAYHHYVKRNEQETEQMALEEEIVEGWDKFVQWVASVDLAGAIQSLLDGFDAMQSS